MRCVCAAEYVTCAHKSDDTGSTSCYGSLFLLIDVLSFFVCVFFVFYVIVDDAPKIPYLLHFLNPTLFSALCVCV